MLRPCSHHTVRIAYSYMRGEDDIHKVCQRHRDLVSKPERMDQFFAHMRTKQSFLDNKKIRGIA